MTEQSVLNFRGACDSLEHTVLQFGGHVESFTWSVTNVLVPAIERLCAALEASAKVVNIQAPEPEAIGDPEVTA